MPLAVKYQLERDFLPLRNHTVDVPVMAPVAQGTIMRLVHSVRVVPHAAIIAGHMRQTVLNGYII